MKKFLILFALAVATGGLPAPAAAQALPNQIQALYPQNAGEVVFVDLRVLRGSPHYAHIKAQALPERFRQLEVWTRLLGVDFENEVRQLSWAFLSAAEGKPPGFVGVAEGAFTLAEVERHARKLKLSLTRYADHPVIVLGANTQGQDFVFAFADSGTAIFGFREEAQAMLDRRAQGGPSVLNNQPVRDLIAQVNGKAPLWVALDSEFATLAVKQMLPEATRIPGFETLTGRVQTASLRFELGPGLRSLVAVRCQTSADALFLSTLMQLGLSYQTSKLGESNPDLARVLGDLQVNRLDDRLDLTLAIREPDLVTLLQKNSFALKF